MTNAKVDATPIERCPEGHEAECVKLGDDEHRVLCSSFHNEWYGCWDGPICSTPEEAIEKWNKLMKPLHAIPKEGD